MSLLMERTQAGSSLVNGRIEVLHYRRMIKGSDEKGLPESYNERDRYNRGIQVEANYWLTFHNIDIEDSIQREYQNMITYPV